MINWPDIKIQIQKETQKAFKGKPFDVKSTIELFEGVLRLPINNPDLKLDGLETRVPHAVEKILLSGLIKADNLAYFPDFAKIESYLRKILFFIDPDKLIKLEEKKAGLGVFIREMKLNINGINLSKAKLSDWLGSNNYGEHLLRTYLLRNVESHQCEEWTSRELYENIESILVIYLFVTEKYSSVLKPLVDIRKKEKDIDFTDYLQSVKDNFKSRIGRFVHIKGQEDLKLAQGFVVENIATTDDERIERKGTVNELRLNKVPENRMLIWGDAGMGKSTTLEYLAYIDSEESLKNNSGNLPVYIQLGLLTDKNISIKQSIFNKIGVDSSIGEMMLKNGQINLFLDAINEIPRDDNNQLKTLRQREIQNIINDYSSTFIIISNRPQDDNIFKAIPVFQLQKMDRSQIETFIDRNTDGNKVLASLIIREIDNDNRLERIIKTPLMLSRFIEIVKIKGNIPKSEGEIIDKFIYSLYQREVEEKKDANFNIKIIHRILRYLGYESLEKKDTNSGMHEDEVLNYFVQAKKKYGFEIDSVYVLDVATQLGIFEKRDDMYTFAHQAYQDYYHAQEEKAILGL